MAITYTPPPALPNWISVDSDNNRLVGAAGTYSAASQAEADALAQAALNAFGEAALANGNLTCGEEPIITLIIEDYVDGLFPTTGGDPSGNPQWDGKYIFHNTDLKDLWKASANDNELSMTGIELCNSYLFKDGLNYVLHVYASFNIIGNDWIGIGPTGDDPRGVYTRIDGDILTPPSVTVIDNPDPEQATDSATNCLPS